MSEATEQQKKYKKLVQYLEKRVEPGSGSLCTYMSDIRNTYYPNVFSSRTDGSSDPSYGTIPTTHSAKYDAIKQRSDAILSAFDTEIGFAQNALRRAREKLTYWDEQVRLEED